MPTKPSLTKFNNIVKKLALSIVKQAKKECKAEWESAFIEVRTPLGGGSCVLKFRIERPDGSIVKNMHVTGGQHELIYAIFEMKDEVFNPTWYGIKITAFSDGRFETAYNHDIDCCNDTTFYDFDK